MRLRDLLPQGQHHLHIGVAERAEHLRTQHIQADLDAADQHLAVLGEPQLVGTPVAAVGLAAQQALAASLSSKRTRDGPSMPSCCASATWRMPPPERPIINKGPVQALDSSNSANAWSAKRCHWRAATNSP